MPELKIHLSDELDERFRKTAMTVHGYGRGSISKAAIEALTKWCNDHEAPGSSPSRSEKEEAPRSTSPEENSPRPNLVEQDPELANKIVDERSPDHRQPAAAA